jgi:hypothetical protein
MIREESYISLADQAKIALFLFGLAMTVYAWVFLFYFRITVCEEKIRVRKPPFSWHSQEKYTLLWDEIEKIEVGPVMFPEMTPFALKPRRGSGKKTIWFNAALENFPELMGIIMQRVPVGDNARAWIDYQLNYFSKKWPITFNRFLFLIVFAVAITLIACLFLGIIRFPSLSGI